MWMRRVRKRDRDSTPSRTEINRTTHILKHIAVLCAYIDMHMCTPSTYTLEHRIITVQYIHLRERYICIDRYSYVETVWAKVRGACNVVIAKTTRLYICVYMCAMTMRLMEYSATFFWFGQKINFWFPHEPSLALRESLPDVYHHCKAHRIYARYVSI